MGLILSKATYKSSENHEKKNGIHNEETKSKRYNTRTNMLEMLEKDQIIK